MRPVWAAAGCGALLLAAVAALMFRPQLLRRGRHRRSRLRSAPEAPFGAYAEPSSAGGGPQRPALHGGSQAPPPPAPAAAAPPPARSAADSGGAGDGALGWAAALPWRHPPDGAVDVGGLRPGPAPASSYTALADPSGADDDVKPRGFNVTALCVQQGTGWVWLADPAMDSAALKKAVDGVSISVSAERTRVMGPVARNKSRTVLWSDRSAFVAHATPPGPPFHTVWDFLAVAAGASSVAPRPAVTYLQTDAGSACLHLRSRLCCTAGKRASEGCVESFVWDLYGSISPLVAAQDPAPGHPEGTVVCHPWGAVAAGSTQMQSRGASATAVKSSKCKVPHFKAGMKFSKGMRRLSCRRNLRHITQWARLRSVRGMLASAYGLRDLAPSPKRAAPRLLAVHRNQTRRILSLRDNMRTAAEEGWDPIAVQLEMHPLPRQLAMLAAADTVVAAHGSAMTWVLFSPPGVTWIEVSPTAKNAPSLAKSWWHLGINLKDRAQYGTFAAYAGAHHIGWNSPPMLGGHKADRWKTADVSIFPRAWAAMLNASRKAWASGSMPCDECDAPFS